MKKEARIVYYVSYQNPFRKCTLDFGKAPFETVHPGTFWADVPYAVNPDMSYCQCVPH